MVLPNNHTILHRRYSLAVFLNKETLCHYMTLSNMESSVPCIATGTIRFIFFLNIINSGRSTWANSHTIC
jgi:hypothetical protein